MVIVPTSLPDGIPSGGDLLCWPGRDQNGIGDEGDGQDRLSVLDMQAAGRVQRRQLLGRLGMPRWPMRSGAGMAGPDMRRPPPRSRRVP